LEHGDKSKDSGSAKKGGQNEKSGSGKGDKGSEGGEDISLGDKVAREQAKKFGANIDV
jgi:hypothetical protein